MMAHAPVPTRPTGITWKCSCGGCSFSHQLYCGGCGNAKPPVVAK
jgi:hypothetical protein